MQNPTHDQGAQQEAAAARALGPRRAAQDVAFREKLRQMALPLAPLVQLTTGEVHPAFPGTLLHFWLLTDSQLEALAHFYHQRTPCPWTRHYPCPVRWASDAPLEEKRRRLGRFIGLRGCESPLVLLPSSPTAAAPADSAAPALLSEDDILEEARAARLAEEERIWRGKHPWFRG